MSERAPLDDPTYMPEHPPVDGVIPPVVARWGPASQRRWFRRFWRELADQQGWDSFYCSSEYHLGSCCYSCGDEAEMGSGVAQDGWCCCRDERIRG